MKQMWLIFKNNEDMLFEIVGQTNDDTDFTNNVVKIQNNGYSVSCSTEYVENISQDNIINEYEKMNFVYSKNLFENMKSLNSKISPLIFKLLEWKKGENLPSDIMYKLQQFGFIFPDNNGIFKITISGEEILKHHGLI